MTILEAAKNTISTMVGIIKGSSYITYNNGYPQYHYSKKQKAKNIQSLKQKEARIQQIQTFRLEDMFQYDDLPFLWDKDLLYANGVAYLPLTDDNKEVCLYYIRQIAKLIYDITKIVPGAQGCSISKRDIDFNLPVNMTSPVPPCTFLECAPYTAAGQKSKYPVILHFRSSLFEKLQNGFVLQTHPISGFIRILCDGQIGAAEVTFAKDRTKFSMSLYGLSLVVKRVDNIYGNLFKFEDIKNKEVI